jgi:hypothetical protein
MIAFRVVDPDPELFATEDMELIPDSNLSWALFPPNKYKAVKMYIFKKISFSVMFRLSEVHMYF